MQQSTSTFMYVSKYFIPLKKKIEIIPNHGKDKNANFNIVIRVVSCPSRLDVRHFLNTVFDRLFCKKTLCIQSINIELRYL